MLITKAITWFLLATAGVTIGEPNVAQYGGYGHHHGYGRHGHGHSTPAQQCPSQPSPICTVGQLFDLSLNATKGKCKPPYGGAHCLTKCAIVADHNYKGKKACSHEFAFAHEDTPQGPSCWHWAYPHCGGGRQSPINILTHKATWVRYHHGLTIQSGYNSNNPYITISKFENTGHSIKATLSDSSVKSTYVYGGPLSGYYSIAQFHFHFNSAGGGSEHRINGRAYHSEMHIVTFNRKYGCFKAAMKYCDGLAVIAVMISSTQFHSLKNALGQSSSNMPNKLFARFPVGLKHCGNNEQKATYFPIKSMLPYGFERNFYTYQGSLTTPPCSESVRWIVTKNGLHVSPSIFSKMSQITVGDSHHPVGKMNGNRRPVQPTNNRKVYNSY